MATASLPNRTCVGRSGGRRNAVGGGGALVPRPCRLNRQTRDEAQRAADRSGSTPGALRCRETDRADRAIRRAPRSTRHVRPGPANVQRDATAARSSLRCSDRASGSAVATFVDQRVDTEVGAAQRAAQVDVDAELLWPRRVGEPRMQLVVQLLVGRRDAERIEAGVAHETVGDRVHPRVRQAWRIRVRRFRRRVARPSPSAFVNSVTTARCRNTSTCTTRLGVGCSTLAASAGVDQPADRNVGFRSDAEQQAELFVRRGAGRCDDEFVACSDRRPAVPGPQSGGTRDPRDWRCWVHAPPADRCSSDSSTGC